MNTMRNFARMHAAALGVAFALGTTGSAFAAETDQGVMIQARQQLLNAEVKNSVGEELGEIEELVLDGRGHVRYVVIEHGGVLDIGDDVVAVPWEQAAVTMGEDAHVIMDLTRAELARAPSFKKGEWPDMQSPAWQAEMLTYTDSFAESHEISQRQDVAAFEALDINRDGHVSLDEAKARQLLSDRFRELDRNGDSRLSRWEFNTFDESMVAEGLPTSPSDKARAQLTEEQQQQRQEIERTNREQNVTKHVGKDANKDEAAKQAKSDQQSKQKSQQKAERALQQADKIPDRLAFTELDQDGDGKLSPKELEAAGGLQKDFSTVDLNDDGAIDRAEFSAFEKELENQEQTPASRADGADRSRDSRQQSRPDPASR